MSDSDQDGVCDEFEVIGCVDQSACNFDVSATDLGECFYPADGLDCNGYCLNDEDGDGICDADEILGCTNEDACNYNQGYSDDGSCTFAESASEFNLSVNPANWGGTSSTISNSIVHIDENNDLACHDLNINLEGSIALIMREIVNTV